MNSIAESYVEEAALAWLSELGYGTTNALDIGPDGSSPERESYGDVVLADRLSRAIAKLNPILPAETHAEVFAKVLQAATPLLIEENRRLHQYLIEGVPVEVKRSDGSIGGDRLALRTTHTMPRTRSETSTLRNVSANRIQPMNTGHACVPVVRGAPPVPTSVTISIGNTVAMSAPVAAYRHGRRSPAGRTRSYG